MTTARASGRWGGGCVEGDIWFAARELMRRGGSAQYRDYELNEDLAAEDGLVCGGTMYFLIDPVYEAGSYLEYAREIDAAYAGGPAVALASVTAAGDGAARLGARLFIREDGSTEGTLGSPEIDREAVKRARELMVHGKNEFVTMRDGPEFFVEAYTTPPQMVLCGGGHVSKAIAPMASTLGFRVFVTDDREEFANGERFPRG